VAAVGVSFISSSVDARGKEALLAEVLKTADGISHEMGYRGKNGTMTMGNTALAD